MLWRPCRCPKRLLLPTWREYCIVSAEKHLLKKLCNYVLYLSVQILADSVGIPCKLVKGSNYTGGDDDDAINIIKMDNERYQCLIIVLCSYFIA